MKNYLLSIQQPCTQSWHDMAPVEGGKHCASCAKKVTDFSGMSDTEVIRILTKNKEGVCGRMRANQLNRLMSAGPEQKPSSFFVKALAGVLMLAGAADVAAQNPLPGNEMVMAGIATATGEEDAVKDEPVPKLTGVANKISGTVKTNYGEPVLCSITLDNTFFCVNTNNDGFFEMEVPDSLMRDTLLFTVTSTSYDPVTFRVLKTELPALKEIIIQEEIIMLGAVDYKSFEKHLLDEEIRILEEKLRLLEVEKEKQRKDKERE